MPWLVIFLSALVIGPRQTALAASGKPVVYDEVILLDVTASLTGCTNVSFSCPGSHNIWKGVQQAAESIVSAVPDGTHLAIVPFDLGPRFVQLYPHGVAPGNPSAFQTISGNAARSRAKAFIQGLNPNGLQTYIYASMQYVLDQLKRQRTLDPRHTHRQSLYLFTDGLDTSPSHYSFADVKHLFGLYATDDPYLAATYVNLSNVACPNLFNGQSRFECVGRRPGQPVFVPETTVALEGSGTVDFGKIKSNHLGTARQLPLTLKYDRLPPGARVQVKVSGSLSAAPGHPTIFPLSHHVTVWLQPGASALGPHSGTVAIKRASGAFLVSTLQRQESVDYSVIRAIPLRPTPVPTPTFRKTPPCTQNGLRLNGQCIRPPCPSNYQAKAGVCQVNPKPGFPIILLIILIIILAALLVLAYFVIDRVRPRFAENATLLVGGTPFNLADLQGTGVRRPTSLPVGGDAGNAIGLPGFESTPAAYVRPFGRDAVQIKGTGAADLTKDGEPIEGWTPMYPGDTVRIGSQSVTYNVTESELAGTY